MKIPLSTLVASVGQAVQQAQDVLEHQSVQRFCSCFSAGNTADGAPVLSPRSRRFSLPDGAGGLREVEAPEAVLMTHNAISLDTVQVRLNVLPSMEEDSDAVLVEVGPSGEAADARYSQLELTFRAAPAAEGIARVNQDAMKFI